MHTSRLQKALSILANLAIVWMELKAIPLSWNALSQSMFLFYTELSNLFAMGVCFAVALCQLGALLAGREMPAWARTLKYTVTCCLMLTFLTVVFVLAPMYGPDGHYVMLLTSSMLYKPFPQPGGGLPLLCPAGAGPGPAPAGRRLRHDPHPGLRRHHAGCQRCQSV